MPCAVAKRIPHVMLGPSTPTWCPKAWTGLPISLAAARRGQPTDPPAFVDTSALRTSDGPAADVVRRVLHAEKR